MVRLFAAQTVAPSPRDSYLFDLSILTISRIHIRAGSKCGSFARLYHNRNHGQRRSGVWP